MSKQKSKKSKKKNVQSYGQNPAVVEKTAKAKKEKKKMSKPLKAVLLSCLAVILLILLSVSGYAIYLFSAYYRLPDLQELTVEEATKGYIVENVVCGEEYSVMSYNIGFGAYERDFGFFMDGGTESRAFSKERLVKNIEEIGKYLNDAWADFFFIQEVDENGTRSYHYNERTALTSALSAYQAVWAQNWDSPYLLYPLSEPHGKNRAGMITFSRYMIESSLRRRLPVESGPYKIVDLDRCYTVSRIATDTGKELVLYNVHLSAYTSDGEVAEKQLKMLIEDMKKEYLAGNYVVCGGDFNKDILGNSEEVFGTAGKEEYSWAKAFPEELLEGTGLTLVKPFEENCPIPSCRNADGPYHDRQFVVTVDGFIVSDNVTVKKTMTHDTLFMYSDHNPVSMVFVLEK